MQYLLTEMEYNEMCYKMENERAKLKEVLQSLCSQVCDHMPTKFWGSDEAKIWGCWLTDGNHMSYCDCCPVQDVCPNPNKRWSK